MENEASDVLAAGAAAGELILLVGHSSGAVVALEAALASPPRFAGLVLCEPFLAVTAPLGGGDGGVAGDSRAQDHHAAHRGLPSAC